MKKLLKRLAILVIAVIASVMMTGLDAVSPVFPASYAADGVTLKLHYNRTDGNYAPWSVWLWEEGKDGSDNAFDSIDGEQIATFDVTPGTMAVGFIVRTENWEKDIDEDQFIDISECVSGTVHVYVESGVKGYQKEYGDDVVKGIKVKTAKSEVSNTVTITMTDEISDMNTAFSVVAGDAVYTIEEVNYLGNNKYELKINPELDSFGSYEVIYEGLRYKINMKNIYSTKEFEEKYTYSRNDLGATWTKEATTFRVWAPTAQSVKVNLYEGGDVKFKDLIEKLDMEPSDNGTWVLTVNRDLNKVYYTYEVEVNGKRTEACDPYAVTTGVNGNRAMVLNLSETNPAGWDTDANPNAGLRITDAIIYEGHIRDLTVGDTGVVNKGKCLGLTETGTVSSNNIPTALDHMKDLGITHLHILPMYDFGSVDETKIVTGIYNWGYDPVNYNVPEGSYSTDAQHGEVRVKEAKEMVKALHDNGISVVMDVVYNHVYSGEEYCFNKIVPGYFSRISDEGAYSSGSGCGNDTASERSMVKKYIVESVNYWADEYHIDGFRFDLVGLLDVDTINEIVETVHAKHPDVIFYGEGWSMSTMVTKEDVEMATQVNSEKTPSFAYFNDTIRDGIKGSVFDKEPGYVSGAKGYDPKIARCFMGADNWCKSPAQTINYASCHDNNTLIDRITLSRKDATREELVAMNKLAAAIYLTSEGVPFMQAGEELLRTKLNADGSFNENSYNAGDKVNAIDYSVLAENEYSDVYDYYKELIGIRKNHAVLRLDSQEEVSKRVQAISTGTSGVVGFALDGRDLAGEPSEEMIVIFNASSDNYTYEVSGDWKLLVSDGKASQTSLSELSDASFSIAPLTAVVAVKGQTDVAANDETGNVSQSGESSSKKTVARTVAAGAIVLLVAAAAILRIKKRK